MCFIKYLLFFSSAIVSVVGAGAVIAGIIVFLIFDRLLPPVIADILKFDFLEALPAQLSILGTVVCLSTLIGCSGAILEGSVAKWLLITYTIQLIIFVALNILIAVVLHLGHQKTTTTIVVASGLTMDPSTDLHEELTDATDKTSFLVRQRRAFYSGLLNSTKVVFRDTTNTIGDQLQKGKTMAGNAIHKVSDTVGSGASAISNTVGSAVDTAHKIGGGLKTAANVAVAGVNLAKDAAQLVLSMFKDLDPEEEKAVRWIRPILGKYTGPIFRLTNSKLVMSTWAIAIGVEIIFIFLNIYLSTTKNRYYQAMEFHDY